MERHSNHTYTLLPLVLMRLCGSGSSPVVAEVGPPRVEVVATGEPAAEEHVEDVLWRPAIE